MARPNGGAIVTPTLRTDMQQEPAERPRFSLVSPSSRYRPARPRNNRIRMGVWGGALALTLLLLAMALPDPPPANPQTAVLAVDGLH